MLAPPETYKSVTKTKFLSAYTTDQNRTETDTALLMRARARGLSPSLAHAVLPPPTFCAHVCVLALARCQGLYSATPSGAFVPGLEFSGTVLKLGQAEILEKSVDSHFT